jgi:oligogalacturonide transport system substrate-binding protein
MKKKQLMAGVMAAGMAMSLAACGGSTSTAASTTESTAASTDAASAAEGDITLRFAWWGGDERANATLEVIKQFEAANPNIHIEAEYGSSDGYHDKLATQLASGTAADIVQIDPETMPAFVATGDYFLNYMDYDFDLSNFEESYISQRVNGRFDGKQLGLPTGIAGPALVVNKELADKYGIDFSQPYTWDQFIEWGKQVHEADPDTYLLCTNKEYVTNLVFFNTMKQMTGKTLFDADTKAANFTQEDIEKSLEIVKALYDNNVCAPASYSSAYSNDDLQSDPNWIAGKYVCSFAYISTMNVMTAANTNATYTTGTLPIMDGAKNDGWSCNCPQVLAVTSTCKNPEAAMKFMDYFFNSDEAESTLACVRSVPPTEKARTICEKDGTLDAGMMEAANIVSAMNGVSNDKYSSAPESKQIMVDTIEAVGYGTTDPATAAADMFNQLNNYISAQ